MLTYVVLTVLQGKVKQIKETKLDGEEKEDSLLVAAKKLFLLSCINDFSQSLCIEAMNEAVQ